MNPSADKVRVHVDGRVLTLSNLAKVLYPSNGFTKGQVIEYYTRIAPVLLPHIADRPLTFKRYPDGVEAGYFYQKNAPSHTPEWVRTALVPTPGSTKDREEIRFVLAGDLPTLVWAANLANLEIHTPMWRIPHYAEPDLLVFDLDPGPPATIVECCRVASMLRPALAQRGLELFPKTSGSKGMQLLAAISGMTSAEASELAKEVAEELERAEPGLIVSRMTKTLRPRKVLIDWSQNNAAKTTVAPYSLRARQSPTVSTPLTWDEVESCTDPMALAFTAKQVLARVEESGDHLAALVS